MANSDLMFAIAETAAIFIAILAGFYTTKLITIASDKKRLLIKIGEVQKEIDWRSGKSDEFESTLNERLRQLHDKRLEDFARDAKGFLYFSKLKSFEDLKKLYQSQYGFDLSEYEVGQLSKMSESLLKEIQKASTQWIDSIKNNWHMCLKARLQLTPRKMMLNLSSTWSVSAHTRSCLLQSLKVWKLYLKE